MTREQFIEKMLKDILGGEAEIKKPEKTPREVSADLGRHLQEMRLGFKDAGFSEEQSFTLMLKAFDKIGGDY